MLWRQDRQSGSRGKSVLFSNIDVYKGFDSRNISDGIIEGYPFGACSPYGNTTPISRKMI